MVKPLLICQRIKVHYTPKCGIFIEYGQTGVGKVQMSLLQVHLNSTVHFSSLSLPLSSSLSSSHSLHFHSVLELSFLLLIGTQGKNLGYQWKKNKC